MLEQIKPQYSLSWISTIGEIPQLAWDELAKPLNTPFLEWEWLNNIETSGSVTPRHGWQPCHLAVWRNSQLIGAAPLYIKGHSYGEFVFDHQWADLSHRLGIEYYPKLLGMSPFTPAVGYRFLIAPGEDEATITDIMVAAIENFCDRNRLSGCNFLFVDPDWREIMENRGFQSWLHHGFIWSNNNFNNFDDYLKMFNTKQRKNIKQERKALSKLGLYTKTYVGAEIPDRFYPQIYRFYSNTCDKFYWGSKYLTRKFFEQLNPNYSDRVLLIAAFNEQDERNPVGMSFCLYKGNNLYGRYWGCESEYDCLHFEACYYKPIEWAIAHGIQMYDPGAGGRHKKRRGFPATANHSLHRFYNRRLNQILRTHIGEINQMEKAEIMAVNNNLPFDRPEINFNCH
jgi:uncharacterized protein